MRILTDYFITKIQCPLWEEQTQNVHYIPFWGSKFKFAQNHLITALRLFLHRKNYDLIITGDFRGSQAFTALQLLFPWNKRPQLMLDFMLDEEKSGPIWKIKRLIQKYILSKVDCILIFSSEELENYSNLLNIPKDKFRFIYYHTNILHPHKLEQNDGYVFAAGKTGRDYETLARALLGTNIPLIIVTTPDKVEGIKLPENCETFFNIPYEFYLKLLYRAKLIVVPLKKRVRSVGMVVMMEAMALGKPVIVTKGASVQEYVRDGENGMLVEVNDAAEMRNKIKYLLKNEEEAKRIGDQALKDILDNWTFDHYVKNVLDIAREIVHK